MTEKKVSSDLLAEGELVSIDLQEICSSAQNGSMISAGIRKLTTLRTN